MALKTRRSLLVVLGISLLLAVLGQYYLARKSYHLWDGIFLYALAMACFVWVAARLEARTEPQRGERVAIWQELWQALRGSRIRLAVLVGGFLLIVYVTLTASSRSPDKRFWDLLALWAVSIALAVGAFVDWAGLPQRLRATAYKLWEHGPEVLLVVLLALLTFLLRGVNLAGIPFVLSGDEASMGLEAVDVIKGQRNNPFVTGWLSHPTLYFFMQAAFLRLFGITTAVLRLPSALISTVTMVLLYLFARRYFGRWVAILASIFFATYHYAIHFGRLAINNIWDIFFALGVFYFYSKGLEEKRLGHILAAGVLMGLAIYVYMGSRLIPIILVIYTLYWALRQQGFLREHLAYMLVFVMIAFIAALPLLSYFRAHPNDMMARWSSMGICPSGWVEAEMQITGKSMLQVVWGQFLKAALAYNFYPDPTFWYHPGIPLLQFGSSIFFVFGLVYAIANWRKKECFLLVIWFLLVIIFGGALLENPPTSPRLVLSIPPVVLCVALGVSKVASYLQAALGESRGTAVAISLAVILLFGYRSAHFYLNDYTRSHVFAGLNTEVADRMGRYLRALGPEYQCYFFGAPRIYYNHATIPFLAQETVGVDVMEPITDRVDFVNPDRRAVFVFLPERQAEFDVVRRFYPNGRLREFRNQQGQPLFVAYEAD